MMLRRYHKRKEEPKPEKVEEKEKTPRKRAKKASDEK